MIRAENGSGKTSLLYALGWALYGDRGLPEDSKGKRLISTAVPAGTSVQVSVSVEFERDAEDGSLERYRLARSVIETARQDDRAERGAVTTKLVRLTSRGDEDCDIRLVEGLLPERLQHVFFTNGEEVETFIKGVDATGRQRHVEDATRALLGLGLLEGISEDLSSYQRTLRQQVSEDGGADLASAAACLEAAENSLREKRDAQIAVGQEVSNLHDAIGTYERRLSELQGIGSLEKINHDLARVVQEIDRLREYREAKLLELRAYLRKPEFAFSIVGRSLEKGLAVLQTLADRRVIPGPSVEVLRDRLDVSVCICGESLADDSPESCRRRERVLAEIRGADAQSAVASRMTTLWHSARILRDRRTEEVQLGGGLSDAYRAAAAALMDLRIRTQAANLEHQNLIAARERIDDNLVRELTERLRTLKAKQSTKQHEAGQLSNEVANLEKGVAAAQSAYESAQRSSGRRSRTTAQLEVTTDLHALASGILGRLQGEYVEEVARKMSDMFLRIVGSDPAFEGAVFTGVRIDSKRYQIIVDTHNGKTLDPKFEINGASQRALTLSFIWALTEVSRAVAPRIIDTPLGMVAGGVKTRMVDAITQPVVAGKPHYQVVLMLTRSEISGIESLLDSRIGKWVTLSCSKDYPVDLRFDWGASSPEVRSCGCSHRKSCKLCARQYDAQSGVEYSDAEPQGGVL
jgi:hypothetical protein